MPTATTEAIANARKAGNEAAPVLTARGYVSLALEPGDRTRYVVTICDTLTSPHGCPIGGRYAVATSFAPVYGWTGDRVHPGYAAEKWGRDNLWTGDIIGSFLTGIAEILRTNDA